MRLFGAFVFPLFWYTVVVGVVFFALGQTFDHEAICPITSALHSTMRPVR
jgi:hypothetical protein